MVSQEKRGIPKGIKYECGQNRCLGYAGYLKWPRSLSDMRDRHEIVLV